MANFRYAITLAQILHDVEGDLEDLEEIGLVAHNFIGNKNTQLHKVVLDVNNGEVQLPCGVDIIEAATYCGEGDYIEDYIESQKVLTNQHYLSGRFITYRRVGNKLYVDKNLEKITLLYHGILLDENGLPEINEKEAIAIADYIAYTIKYKEAIRTNNKMILQVAQDLRQQWLFHCDAARVAENISQNEMDAILNELSSWDRKWYGKGYKPVM